MGLVDGLALGTALGLALGDSVGLVDGLPVGLDVGEAVGLAVGNRVGEFVGLDVGELVGDVVGLAVGNAVGLAVGNRVGDPVGLFVGAGLGLSELGDDTVTGCDVSTAALAIAASSELCSSAVTLVGSLVGAAIATCNSSTMAPTTSVGSVSLASSGLAPMTAALGTATSNAISTEESPWVRRAVFPRSPSLRRWLSRHEPGHTAVTVTCRASTPAIVAAMVRSSEAFTSLLSSASALTPSRWKLDAIFRMISLVGEAEGTAVGSAVGVSVVGAAEGASEGAFVGAPVVGAAVGTGAVDPAGQRRSSGHGTFSVGVGQ